MTHPSFGVPPLQTRRSEQVRRDARWSELERLRSSNPMFDAVVEEVRGRRIRVGDDWLADFASSDYLGFGSDPEILDAVVTALGRWGTSAGWSRLVGGPHLYPQIEEQLAELVAAPDALVLPTLTDVHASVLPVLAGRGQVFVDATAHHTVYDGCSVAHGQGAALHRFPTGDLGRLGEQLAAAPADRSKIVVIQGVNRLTGNVSDVAAFAALAREHGAWLYVDDTETFGVLGEPGERPLSPYGLRGNGVLRHTGVDHDQVVVVGSFVNAYSAPVSFVTLPTELKNYLKVIATPYLYSGPAPVAALAGVLAGLAVNRSRGDQVRTGLFQKSDRVLRRLADLRIHVSNTSGLPFLEIPLVEPANLDAVGRYLFDRGVWATLTPYPLVPRDHVGLRIAVTAAHGDAEIDHLVTVLGEVAERFPLPVVAGDGC